jgi:hypothetical protein
MRVGNPQYPRYTKLDTTWSSHCAAAARKLKAKEPNSK